MTRNESDPITDRFAVDSRDLTPASASHATRVLYVPVARDSELSSLCASVLSESEIERADRFAAKEDRDEFERRRAFRRYCGTVALGSSQPLSEIAFSETENGRPYLSDAPDLWFSFSSCRFGILGAWSSTHAVGVDVEDHSKELEAIELARQYFSFAEAEAVERASGTERLRTFYRLWTLKESALKALGEGLPFGLDAFEFELGANLRIVRVPPAYGDCARFGVWEIEGTEGCAAVVTRTLT